MSTANNTIDIDRSVGDFHFDIKATRDAGTGLTESTIDYIVRRERGTINRAIYEIAMIQDPSASAADPWNKSAGWNGRLVYSFGGGCAAGPRRGDLHPVPGARRMMASGLGSSSQALDFFGP